MSKIDNIISQIKKEKIPFKLVKSVPPGSKIIFPKLTNELGYFKQVPCPKNLFRSVYLDIEGTHTERVLKIIRGANFFKIFSREISSVHYLYDKNEGFLEINVNPDEKILEKKKEKRMGRKGFFVCFVAPEGGGKTTALSATYMILENFPVVREYLTFSSFRASKLSRIVDIKRKLLKVLKDRKTGRIVFSDRYLYLTFRKKPFLKKILWKIIPEPDLLFIMKAPYKILKKRRGPLCKPKKEVEEIYSLFERARNKIRIDSRNKLEDNMEIIINSILKLYDEENRKKYFS